MSIPSAELQMKMSLWRQKAVEGTLTQDEMREAIALMRAGRAAGQTASASGTSRRAKAKAEIPSADDMLNELGGS